MSATEGVRDIVQGAQGPLMTQTGTALAASALSKRRRGTRVEAIKSSIPPYIRHSRTGRRAIVILVVGGRGLPVVPASTIDTADAGSRCCTPLVHCSRVVAVTTWPMKANKVTKDQGASRRQPGPIGPLSREATRNALAHILAPSGARRGCRSDCNWPPRSPALGLIRV
jgi:hypothetical protein